MEMKKYMSLLATGLACVGLLGACSNKMSEKMDAETEMSKDMASGEQMDDKSMKEEKMTDASMEEEKMGDKAMMMNDGVMASDFSLQDVNGMTYKLSDLKGKKVYLKFWASWCSICLASLEETDELAKTAGDDVVILSVVSPDQNGEKSAEDFKKWYQDLGYKHLPVLLDTNGELLKEYMVRSYSTNIFIGSDGTLIKTQAGFMDKAAIEEALAAFK